MVGDESQAIHAFGKPEDAFGHLPQFKIGSQQLVVNFKQRVLLLVAIVAEVPRLDFHRLTLQFAGELGETLHLVALNRQIGLTQLVKHFIDVSRRFGHGVLQFILGKGLATHQPSNLQASVSNLPQDFQIAIIARSALAVIHLI